jgi:hypothetical protein
MEKYFDLDSFERAVDTVASADVLASIALLEDHPILLLAGDSGALGAGGESFKRRADAVKALAPKTQVRVIPKTGGTYSMLEQPDACVGAVTEFLEASAGARSGSGSSQPVQHGEEVSAEDVS